MTLVAPASRFIHARGYTNPEDYPTTYFNECSMALMASKNTPNMIFTVKKYEEIMTDKQIMYAFHWIAQNKLEKTQDFWNYLIPLVKTQMKGLDKHTCPSFYKGVEAAALMQLQDNEFWEIVENKFVDEGLWLYLTLEDTVRFLCCLAKVGRGSDEIVDVIEKHLIKHRKGLTTDTINIAKQGFAKINKGSEILHRVLADPKTELPALE